MHVVVVSICFSSKNCDLQNFDFFMFKIKFLLLWFVDMKIKFLKNILKNNHYLNVKYYIDPK
jgi:hypothetical protein